MAAQDLSDYIDWLTQTIAAYTVSTPTDTVYTIKVPSRITKVYDANYIALAVATVPSTLKHYHNLSNEFVISYDPHHHEIRVAQRYH